MTGASPFEGPAADHSTKMRDLNLMGRIRVRHELLVLLQNRLQVEATYKQHPEIENEEIVKPLTSSARGVRAIVLAEPALGHS